MKTSNHRTQLEDMLNTYNLIDTLIFPTRITNNSATLIDYIFIDNRRSHVIKPCINGQSDHDAQLIILNNTSVPNRTPKSTYTRNISLCTGDCKHCTGWRKCVKMTIWLATNNSCDFRLVFYDT
jgi:hypothetical protein